EVPAPSEEERRRARRYPSIVPVRCATVDNFRNRIRGLLRDVSTTGALMRLPRRFEPGTLVVVEVLGEQEKVTQTVVVTVRWVKKVAAKEWTLGCSFDKEIAETDLNALLGNPGKTAVLHPQ